MDQRKVLCEKYISHVEAGRIVSAANVEIAALTALHSLEDDDLRARVTAASRLLEEKTKAAKLRVEKRFAPK